MENEKEKRIGANKREGVRWIRGKKKGKTKTKRGGNRTERERKNVGEEEERGKKKREIFLAFRRSNLDGTRVKVYQRYEGYAWVPKCWSFVKLQEVGNFSTLIIFSLKDI